MQVKQAEEDLLQARQRNAVLVTDRARVDEKIAGLKLETESSTRQLKVAVADKERAAVEHDVMKLEVKRLRDILNMRADEVYSLEARRLQLKTSMEERRHEIEVQRCVWHVDQREVQLHDHGSLPLGTTDATGTESRLGKPHAVIERNCQAPRSLPEACMRYGTRALSLLTS